MLIGIDGVIIYIDDIVEVVKDEEEHNGCRKQMLQLLVENSVPFVDVDVEFQIL